jgi:ribosomal protein L37AE/L43A
MAECIYRLSITEDGIWECSNCDIAWQFDANGPKENQVYYCPKCGAKIVRLERTEWDSEQDKSVIRGEAYGKD